MANIKKLTLKGLYTYRSEFADMPDGALTTCTNVSLDKANIASPRPGFNVQSLPIAGGNIHSFQDFNNYLFFGQNQGILQSQEYVDTIAGSTSLSYITGNNPYTLLLPPNGSHFDFAQMAGNLYFTTLNGVRKVTTLANGTNVVWDAGMPAPAPTLYSAYPGGGGNPTGLPGYTEATWRFVYFRQDSAGITYFGPPSDPVTYTNINSTHYFPYFIFPLPPGYVNDGTWWFQAYRTLITSAGTSPGTIPASGDEEFLCYEIQMPLPFTSGDSMYWVDFSNDSSLGASLYTNSDQQGIAYSNVAPPTSKYISEYQNMMFYGNTVSAHTAYFQALANLTVGAYVQIAMNVNSHLVFMKYTAIAYGATPSYFQFNIGAGTSPGQDQESIGRSLSSAINFASSDIITFTVSPSVTVNATTYTQGTSIFSVIQYTAGGTALTCRMLGGGNFNSLPTSGTPGAGTLSPVGPGASVAFSSWGISGPLLQSHYASGSNEVQGKIEVQAVGSYLPQFSTTCDAGSATLFTPNLFASPLLSTQSINPNRIYWSSPSEPEAVPVPNYNDVGAADDPIVGIVALRDRLIILKQNSVWRMTGTDPSSFWFQMLDNTVSITAPRTIKRLSNSVFALSNQGIVQISDSVSIVSRRVHDRVTTLNQVGALAAADDARGLYVVFPRPTSDNRLLVYNTFNDIFYDWVLPNEFLGPTVADNVALLPGALYLSKQFTANQPVGAPNPNNRLLVADSTLPYVQIERKSFTDLDFADQVLSLSTTAPISSTFTVSSTDNLAEGDMIVESSGTGTGTISSINSATSITMNILTPFSTLTGPLALNIYKAIDTQMQFWPFLGEGIDWYKDFNELSIICPVRVFGTIDLNLQTDEIYTAESVELTDSDSTSAWGLFPWGIGLWGEDTPSDTAVERILVPWNAARGHELVVSLSTMTSAQYWEIAGITIKYRDVSFTPARRQ